MTKNESYHLWRPSVISIKNQGNYYGDVIGGSEISTAEALRMLDESANEAMAQITEAYDRNISEPNRMKSIFYELEKAVSEAAESLMA